MVPKHYHSDRTTHKYLHKESSRYNVPSPTKHFVPKATGKKSLQAAMKDYHKELDNSITNSPIFKILSEIAPYINNVFVFGYYNDTSPVIAPDNPYLYPQTKKGKLEHEHALKQAGENSGQ